MMKKSFIQITTKTQNSPQFNQFSQPITRLTQQTFGSQTQPNPHVLKLEDRTDHKSPKKPTEKPRGKVHLDTDEKVVPMSIKTLLEVTVVNDGVQLEGISLGNAPIFQLVARVVSSKYENKGLILVLEDSTASATVIKAQSLPFLIKSGTYVEAFVSISAQGTIFARTSPKIVTDYNQAIFHNLYVMKAWMSRNVINKTIVQPGEVEKPSIPVTQPDPQDLGVAACQEAVMKLLLRPKGPKGDFGTSYEQILGVLESEFTSEEIAQAISSLDEDGHLYSTTPGVYKAIRYDMIE